MYGTVKTHKFDEINDITVDNLKSRPIIDQTGTYTYKAAKIIAKYLNPLTKNDLNITDTQSFPDLISNLPPLNKDEEDVSYDVESLFTNIPIKETIDYIIKKIYDDKEIPIICSKLIFKRLLLKLTTESTFIFNSQHYKQTDGCAMGGPLSVVFSSIWMIKMEQDIVIPTKPKFYRRYVDDIINRRSTTTIDSLFNNLNNYHPNIKLTIEVQPKKFLDTQLSLKEDGTYKPLYIEKQTNSLYNGALKYLNATKETTSMETFIALK